MLFFETEKEEKNRNPIPKEWNLYYLLIWPNPDIKSQCFINTHKVPEPEGIDLQYTLSFAVTFLLQQIPKISNLANFCNKPLYLQTDTIYNSLERRFIQESSRLDRCRRRSDSPLRSILLRIDRHQDEPAQNTVEIPDWLAEGADYAEKIYRTGDQSQGYDFVVHYKNGNIKSVFCKQEGQEFTPRELPKNSIDVTCGPS